MNYLRRIRMILARKNLHKTSGPVEKKTVLVLNTYGGWKLPFLVDANGRNDANIFMVFDEGTEVYHSCSLTWRNEFFVFGGDQQNRQISKLSGCRLSLVGTLAFDHYRAACSNVDDEAIYLCFNENAADNKKCRSAVDPLGNFADIHFSTFEHRQIRIASSQSEFFCQSFDIKIFRRDFGSRKLFSGQRQNGDVPD